MDAIKKLLVLLTAMAVVAGVTWLMAISSEPEDGPLSGLERSNLDQPFTPDYQPPARIHREEPQPQVQEDGQPSDPALSTADEPTPSHSENRLIPLPQLLERESAEAAPEQQTAAAVTREEEPLSWQNAPPAISGKIPLNGNPNAVFTTAARRILPAVVAIHSARRVQHPSSNFFHPFLWKKDDEEEPDDIIQPGSGSGILISDQGYVMTNHHVVESADKLSVILYDKREFEATLIGLDPNTDLAVLKISGEDLPYAYTGNSDSVQIGEWVMAVGNPLNFTSTVTAGIISALGRDIRIIDQAYRIENFIQTDAVINPGNSGGALVNLNGEVIGINTAIATRTGLYQGYGFAIPINLARKVVDDIISYGYTRRALLGVAIDPVDDRAARALGLPKPQGALVQTVQKNFPAAEAGLRQGDVILQVDGVEVQSVNDLQIKIARRSPGEKVTLLIWRDRKKFNMQVELAEAPNPARVSPNAAVEENGGLQFKDLGLSFRELNVDEFMLFDVSYGIMIERVAAGSPAAEAGAIPQSVLVSINDETIKSMDDFQTVLRSARSGSMLQMKIIGRSGDDESVSRIIFIQVP